MYKMVSGKTKDYKFVWERPILRSESEFVSRRDNSQVFHTPVATFTVFSGPMFKFKVQVQFFVFELFNLITYFYNKILHEKTRITIFEFLLKKWSMLSKRISSY